jgi:hypothetical protein
MKRPTPTDEEFARLRTHLANLDPIFERFCREYGFYEVKNEANLLGRYPRRKINRDGKVILTFDMEMDLDEEGEYFREFNPSLPYTGGAGAWVDLEHWRYAKGLTCFQKLPFFEVEKTLWQHLASSYETIKNWDVNLLVKEGRKTSLAVAR